MPISEAKPVKLNKSRQREKIYDFLMTRHDHPTAEVVYENVRADFPSISLGTVYRNLQLLTSIGRIQKLHFEDGSDHFDADVSRHYHFACRKCGSVEDIMIPVADGIDQEASKGFAGVIEGHMTYFYGLCGSCADGPKG